MTYIVTENCVECKFTDCVEVCPVDCFYQAAENPTMLFIHPDECIDCGACEPECPVAAIFAEEDVPEDMAKYYDMNVKESTADDAVNITAKEDPLPTAEAKKERLGL